MKEILSKIFKVPVAVFSAGVIVAFALFVFLQPQKSAVGIGEAHSSQVAVAANVAPQTPAGSSDDWSIWFMFNNKEKNQHLMLDLNGDGLTDYIVDSANNGQVYLGNGHGWDLVYEGGSGGCFYEYEKWPKSSGFAVKDWYVPMKASLLSPILHSDEEHKIDLFADLNGDGLVDYIFKEEPIGNAITPTKTCVMLNNGHGWDIAYRCVASAIPDDMFGTRYYGDCAYQ